MRVLGRPSRALVAAKPRHIWRESHARPSPLLLLPPFLSPRSAQVLALLPTEASATDLLEVTAALARVLLQLLRIALELPASLHRTRQFCEHVVGARHVVRTVLGAWYLRTRIT